MISMYKLVAMVAGIVIVLASCGNAGARTDNNADSKTQNTQTKGAGVQELNAASFNSKVYDMTSEGLKYFEQKGKSVYFVYI